MSAFSSHMSIYECHTPIQWKTGGKERRALTEEASNISIQRVPDKWAPLRSVSTEFMSWIHKNLQAYHDLIN